jgi:hypothetical protein
MCAEMFNTEAGIGKRPTSSGVALLRKIAEPNSGHESASHVAIEAYQNSPSGETRRKSTVKTRPASGDPTGSGDRD